MLTDVPSESQLARARVLATFSRVSAPSFGSAALTGSSQLIR